MQYQKNAFKVSEWSKINSWFDTTLKNAFKTSLNVVSEIHFVGTVLYDIILGSTETHEE